MNTVTLLVDTGAGTKEVTMPSATTGKYAFARVVEALGGHPLDIRGHLICRAHSNGWVEIGDAEVIADHDGHTVMGVVHHE